MSPGASAPPCPSDSALVDPEADGHQHHDEKDADRLYQRDGTLVAAGLATLHDHFINAAWHAGEVGGDRIEAGDAGEVDLRHQCHRDGRGEQGDGDGQPVQGVVEQRRIERAAQRYPYDTDKRSAQGPGGHDRPSQQRGYERHHHRAKHPRQGKAEQEEGKATRRTEHQREGQSEPEVGSHRAPLVGGGYDATVIAMQSFAIT